MSTQTIHRSPVWIVGLLLFFGVASCTPTPESHTSPTQSIQPKPTLEERTWNDATPTAIHQLGTTWLLAQQHADGSFGPETALGEVTASILPVLAQLAQDPNAPQHQALMAATKKAGNSLVSQAPGWPRQNNSGPLAKAVLALAVAGQDPSDFAGADLLAALQNQLRPDTALYHPESLFRHNLTLLALTAAEQPLSPQTVQALIGLQQEDGGWSWRIPASGDSFAASDVDTTALSLVTLAVLGAPATDPVIQNGLHFLAIHQHPDGGWSMDQDAPPNANSTGLVLRALGELDLIQPQVAEIDAALAQRWLAQLQQADGSFWYTLEQPGAILPATLDALPGFQWDFQDGRPPS